MLEESYFLSRIKGTLPKSLFTGIRENFDAAFHEAHRQANDRSQRNEPEWPEILGRYRHWNCESGFREASAAAGLSVVAPHTRPLGGRYTIAHTPDFIIGRAKVAYPTERPRPTKYRQELGTLNAFASYKQTNLFQPLPTFRDDKMFGLFIAGANRHNPSVPAFVHFAIPKYDLSGWLFSMPIEHIVASYVEPEKVEEIIPDLARVTLKNPRLEP